MKVHSTLSPPETKRDGIGASTLGVFYANKQIQQLSLIRKITSVGNGGRVGCLAIKDLVGQVPYLNGPPLEQTAQFGQET